MAGNASDCNEASDSNERLVGLITSLQRDLYTYIFSLVHRSEDAQDILQETNLVLWRKAAESSRADNFKSWACRIAYVQVMAYRKRHSRDRLYFDKALLDQLAQESEVHAAQSGPYLDALRACCQQLPDHCRKMLRMRYDSPGTVEETARQLGRSAASVSQALYRMRRTLMDCIRETVALETNP